MRRQAVQLAELSLIDSSLSTEEQERINNNGHEVIRKLEVRRMKELPTQIEEWNNSDFEDATILIEECREDSNLLDALQ